MKQIDIQGNWTVDDGVSGGANALVTLKADVTKSREGVSTQTGLVIWNVNRGAGSMYRYGIVPAGATARGTSEYRGFYLNGVIPGDAASFPNMTWKHPVAIPYCNLTSSE
jgi:hypothetical protein